MYISFKTQYYNMLYRALIYSVNTPKVILIAHHKFRKF